MGAQLILGLFMSAQALQTPVISAPALQSLQKSEVSQVTAALVPRCNARPYQRLVGRTVSDLLTIRLPANTRIYRLDDPPITANQAGRLTVELSRSTRVRRVYCS